MTPAEHYAEAERLAAKATEVYEQLASPLAEVLGSGTATADVAMSCLAVPNYLLARAQVHATLATANPDVWLRPSAMAYSPGCMCDFNPLTGERRPSTAVCPIHEGAAP